MARILVVEDDEDMLEMLTAVLNKEGYTTAQATNGNEAICALEHEPYDCIITDIVMPKKDGLSTILETKRKNKDMKIIAISGGDKSFDGSSYLKIARNIGVEKTLTKPFGCHEFLQAVKEVVH